MKYIPGFVAMYKDDAEYIHLYFFPGVNNNTTIYNSIDLSDIHIQYDETKYDDGAIDYKFYNKNIYKIYCKLIETGSNKEHFKTLIYK